MCLVLDRFASLARAPPFPLTRFIWILANQARNVECSAPLLEGPRCYKTPSHKYLFHLNARLLTKQY